MNIKIRAFVIVLFAISIHAVHGQITDYFIPFTKSDYQWVAVKQELVEINDVQYDMPRNELIIAGRTTLPGNVDSKPWIGIYKPKPEFTINYNSYDNSDVIKSYITADQKTMGISYSKIVPVGQSEYVLLGSCFGKINLKTPENYHSNATYNFMKIGYMYGILNHSADKLITGFYLFSDKRFYLQMVDRQLGMNKPDKQAYGYVSYANQENECYHFCEKPDAEGNFYLIETFYKDYKLKLILNKVKFKPNELDVSPVVSIVDLSTQITGEMQTDMLRNWFNTLESTVVWNKNGNLSMIFTSDTKNSNRKSNFVGFMEISPKGKLLKLDTIRTFKTGHGNILRARYDGFDSFTILNQYGSEISDNEFRFTFVVVNATTGAITMHKNYITRHSTLPQNNSDGVYDSRYLPHLKAVGVVRYKPEGITRYMMVLHSRIFDMHKDRLIFMPVEE